MIYIKSNLAHGHPLSEADSIYPGGKPCKGTKIDKGELRLGAWVTFQERGSFKWRHWGCRSRVRTRKSGIVLADGKCSGTTPQVINNMKKDFEEPSELDGCWFY